MSGFIKSKMTDKQIAEVERVFNSLRNDYGIHIDHSYYSHNMMVDYLEETRTGRGQDIYWLYMDGDYAIAGSIDVYGYGWLNIGRIDWIHGDSDEECDCVPCTKDRLDNGYYEENSEEYNRAIETVKAGF